MLTSSSNLGRGVIALLTMALASACGLQGPALEVGDGGAGGAEEGAGGATSQGCPDVLAMESSSTQLAGFSAEIGGLVAAACHAIASDLLLDAGPLPSPASNEEVTELCEVARSGIVAKVMSVGSVSVAFSPPECVEDEAAQESCLVACGAGMACERACAVERDLGASCPPPEVRVYVMGTVSTAYVSSLEEHLPVLIQVRARSEHGLSGVPGLLAALQATSPDDLSPMCSDALANATDVGTVGAQDAKALSAAASSVLDVLGIGSE